jgi:predicted aspartyl protease
VLLPAAVLGTPSGQLADLLDRVRDSLSEGRDPRAVRALRIEATIEMGGQVVGRVETVARREPRALRESLEMAGVRRELTILEERVWMKDANGAVRAATGDEIVDAHLAHALLFHEYLDGSGARLDVRPGADREIELRDASDPASPPRTLAFAESAADPHLVLPSAFRQRDHGVTVVTTFEDWRVVDGVRFPFASKQSTGDPRFDLTLRTVACEILDDLPAGAIAPPVPDAPDFEIADADSARTIPVELVDHLVLVTAEVNGVPGSFLLDSGAGATVLDSGFASRLGLAERGVMEARGTGGSETAAFVDASTLQLPGVVLRGQTIVTIGLDGVAEALGRPIAGILGWDFLSRFAVEIDYARARLALAPSGKYEPRPGAVRVPLRIEMNVPRVEGTLDGEHRGSFLVDTGNGRGLLLHSPFARAHGYGERRSDGAVDVAGVGGSTRMDQITIRSLALGGAEFRDLPAFVSDSDEGIVAIDEAIGNVGGALFERSVLAFDYSEESLWILPPSSASASGR